MAELDLVNVKISVLQNMYRSFITCDDPSGVIECGMIRKSKIAPHRMEDKVKSRRVEKKSTSSLAYKGKKEEMVDKGNDNIQDYHSASSFQLLQVCRGAQKLNHLIDSWSRGMNYDGQSKYIAKDLLKGALDLQESLTMLGKLQEASQYMAQWKKKQKEKLERGRIDEVGMERMDSYRFGDDNQHRGWRNPRLSADASSRDCIEELRSAIRDDLARQNMPSSNMSRQEERSFHKKKMGSVLHMPSSSSTQLPSSQTGLYKSRSPNLIAKLMGLEDVPSKEIMQSPQKQSDMEKMSSPRRPVFDIEMPRLRKPQSMVDSDRRALKEILETVQFQGLLRDGSTRDLKPPSGNLHCKQKLVGDISPIVLIKPVRFSRSEPEKAPASMAWEEAAWSLRKMKMKQGSPFRATDEKRITSDSRKMNCRTVAEKFPVEIVEKEVRMVEQKEGATDMNRVNAKLKASKPLLKRHNHEEGTKEEQEIKKKLKDSSKMNYQQQKKHKKVDKIDNNRKALEKEMVKTENVTRSSDQAKLICTRLSKPGFGSLRKPISKNMVQDTIYVSKNQKHKKKQVIEHQTTKPVTDHSECREDEKRIDLSCNDHSQKRKSTTMVADQPSMEEGASVVEVQTEELFANKQNSSDIITMPASGNGKDSNSCEENDDELIQTRTDKTGNVLKDLLFSSPSFLQLAEPAFHQSTSHSKISPTHGLKLYLDYANEHVERRSVPDSETGQMGNSGLTISLDQLVEEVCMGIETLKSFHKLPCADNLYATIEKDMMSKGMVSGIWDSGWRCGWSSEEADETVTDLERLLVSELIEEVFS